MTDGKQLYFGGPLFESVQLKSDQLWPRLKDNPSYSFHGRAIGLADASVENLDLLASLVQSTGVCLCDFIPVSEVKEFQSRLTKMGLVTDRMEMWVSDQTTVEKSREVVETTFLSGADELVFVSDKTSVSELMSLDEFTQEHGTSLPMESFLRGGEQLASCVYARDSNGKVFATAASVGQYHIDHVRSDMAYWGMLATREDKRGQGAALLMGAHAIVTMHDLHGLKRFFTPIKDGNTASERLCSKLGFSRQDFAGLIAIDPSILPNKDE